MTLFDQTTPVRKLCIQYTSKSLYVYTFSRTDCMHQIHSERTVFCHECHDLIKCYRIRSYSKCVTKMKHVGRSMYKINKSKIVLLILLFVYPGLFGEIELCKVTAKFKIHVHVLDYLKWRNFINMSLANNVGC